MTADVSSTPERRSATYRRATSSADPLVQMAREESGRVLALLARRFGLELAEDAVQDALGEAARVWPVQGVPSSPPAWLMTVAKRKAIDRVRREASARRRTRGAALDRGETWIASSPGGDDLGDTRVTDALLADDGEVDDDQLRLMLLCCHPALDLDAQVALTLRLVGGLTTAEIAAGFLVPEPTLAQRLVRAKRKIRDAGIPLSIPQAIDNRIDALLGVLYLVFNEGYLSRSGGDIEHAARVDLIDEAIRLTDLLVRLLPDHAEANGLLALQLFHAARRDTRFDDAGDLVLLDTQDRTRWNRDAIQDANAVLARALRLRQPGTYQLQAVIAAHHANAPTAADTDWRSITRLYEQLVAMTHSPVVRLNHAIAVSMADGPSIGLGLLDEIDGLEAYHLFHAARAEMLARLGEVTAASEGFSRALALTDNPAERRHLERRLDELGPRSPSRRPSA